MTPCRRGTLFLAAMTLLTAPFAGPLSAADLTQEDIVKLVLDSYRENYRPLKTIQAKVHLLAVMPHAPQALQKPSKDESPKPDAGIGQLKITIGPRLELDWTATMAGANERYEISSDTDHQIFLRRGELELKYSLGHFARLYRLDPDNRVGDIHYDPRQAMLGEQYDRVEWLWQSNRVRRAEMITMDDGEKVARIDVKSVAPHRLVVECAASAAYLPTRVFMISDSDDPAREGTVLRAAVVEYGNHLVNGTTVLFPKRVEWKSAGIGDVTRKTEDYKKLNGQVCTFTVTELKFNEKLNDDAFDRPFIVPGTRVQNDVGPDRNQIPLKF